MPVLAALGIPLRERLLWVLGLIAVYVPLAGAGPSIQRAGGDGRGRACWRRWPDGAPRASTRWRWRCGGHARDRPRHRRRRRLAAQLRRGARHPPARRAAARARSRRGSGPAGLAPRPGRGGGGDGCRDAGDRAADRLPLRRTLDRDPGRQPAGAARGRAGDVAGDARAPAPPRCRACRSRRSTGSTRCCSPTSPRSPPGARGPAGPQVHVRLGAAGLAASYLALAAAVVLAIRLARRRRLAAARARGGGQRLAAGGRDGRSGLAAAVRSSAGACGPRGSGPGGGARRPGRGLHSGRSAGGPAGRGARRRPGRRDPAAAGDAPAVLVDGGPPGDDLAAKLGAGRGRRASAPRSSPTTSPTTPAGSRSCSASCPDRPARSTRASAARSGRGGRAAGAVPMPGRRRQRSCAPGALRLEVALAAAELLAEPLAGEDPNQLALVLLARWRGFSMLLTADAEAESMPLDPGPVDVLKVAHHGSDDAGLGGAARPHPAAAGGDLGRRRQPLRPPDRRHARDAAPRTGPRPCAPIETARSCST